jgi:hypothetical protein
MPGTELLGRLLALQLGEEEVPMLSRSIAIVFASFLPTAALIFPLSPAHRVNALIAGTLATVLAGFSMAYDRARMGAVLIGGWVALTPFIFPSTLLEQVITVSWGAMMFVSLAGPFSQAPRRTWIAATQPAKRLVEDLVREPVIRAAAAPSPPKLRFARGLALAELNPGSSK